ncbi:hypothetical protein K8W59_18250 [Nocardioides rotundus]|nr:hypothetical protein K8W59_18250 [Nocardioides rotundus]
MRYATRGCVYWKYRPRFVANSKAYPQSAAIIARSQRISGAGVDFALRRTGTTSVIRANRRAALRECRNSGTRRAGQDCDEFPFASTWDGCAQKPRMCHARYISSTDNRGLGARLGEFYRKARVLGGDFFYVKVR